MPTSKNESHWCVNDKPIIFIVENNVMKPDKTI